MSTVNDAFFDAGELRHRFTFLVQGMSLDVSGESVSWAAGSPPDQTWGKFEPMNPVDIVRSGQDVSKVPVIVSIRYRPGVLASSRIQGPNGNVLVIQGIRNVRELNVKLVLACLAIGTNE